VEEEFVEADLGEVYAARRLVRRYLPPTPLFHSPSLSRRLGCAVHVKCENLSPIRSFKARGAIYCLSRLGPEVAGVICASTGNHGQGMAYAARLFNRRAVVYVPETTTARKMAAIQHFGAELRVAGHNLSEANAEAKRVAEAEQLLYVEDGEDREVFIGCATLGLEVVEQLPDLDTVFVPVGGGNLIAACALALKALRPDSAIVGVQSEAAPAVYESWRAGRTLTLERCDTFAGGLATKYPGPLTFPYIQSLVDEITLVSEDAVLDAALTMLEETGQLPEGAGAAALAGLLADPERRRGRTVVLILSGGNFEPVIWDRVRAGP
jgi:threonine dehydratase